MISYLLHRYDPDNCEHYKGRATITVFCDNIGYEVTFCNAETAFKSVSTYGALPVHVIYKEESQTMYGFPNNAAKSVFLLCLKAKGCGPSAALKLSALGSSAFYDALERQDPTIFGEIKGIGKETCKKLLDLQKKVRR